MAVAQSIRRRLSTPRGALQGLGDEEASAEELSFGFDLTALIGQPSDEIEAKVPGMTVAEVEKDDRVVSATASVSTELIEPTAYEFTVTIECFLTTDENLSLTLGVSETSVQLITSG